MKRPSSRLIRHSQQGSVAVEAAVCIAVILVPLLFFIFSFGRFFWHYTVVQKAVHDATLYMAKAPLSEVRSGEATKMANFVIEREITDLDSTTRVAPWSQCGYRVNANSFYMVFGSCDNPNLVPFAVQTNTSLTVSDPFYFGISEIGEIQLVLTTTMRHAGK